MPAAPAVQQAERAWVASPEFACRGQEQGLPGTEQELKGLKMRAAPLPRSGGIWKPRGPPSWSGTVSGSPKAQPLETTGQTCQQRCGALGV